MQQISNSHKNMSIYFSLVSKNYAWVTLCYWKLIYNSTMPRLQSVCGKVKLCVQNVLLFLILLNNARREDGSFHQTHTLTFLGNHEYDMIFQTLLPKNHFRSCTVGDFSPFTLDNADACLKISNAGSAGSSPLSCGLEAKSGTLRALKYLSEHAGCFVPLFSAENPTTDSSARTILRKLPCVPNPSQSSFAGHFSPWTYPVAVRQNSQHKWHHLWPWYHFQQQAPCWYVLRCFSVQ